ncbi:MAG TPA: molecular chaperone TorD family protein [Burkholderiales bacterium]|nr:molecular chaperone TorD family protein [Burkholderiales bacterium]
MTAATRISEEDQARAHCYAVIGRLMYGAADAPLLRYLAGQPATDSGGPYGVAWKALQSACREADAEHVQREYDDLFVGVGKAPVTLYTSAYAAPQAPDRHLLALRTTLGSLGLARRVEAGETEDHIAAVCDVMRWLIENARGLESERQFFYDFVAPAMESLARAMVASPRAAFYRSVGDYMLAFCEVERTGFELEGMDGR